MSEAKDIIRQDRGKLEEELRIAGAVTRGKSMRCPFHDDKTPSAGVYQRTDGVWAFKCHGCGFEGDIFDVRARAQRRPVEDVLWEVPRPDPEPSPQPRVYSSIDELKANVYGLERCYTYTNPGTLTPDMVVIRALDSEGKKHFIQARPEAGGFVMKAPPQPWPIYNRIRIGAVNRVIVVEGEKCVHRLADIGFVATTSPGGAGKAQYADWRPLAGKQVWLWPDADPADEKTGIRKGLEHMRDVARALEQLTPVPEVRWIDPDPLNLPPKGDVVEYLELYGGDTRESQNLSVGLVLEDAVPMGPSGEVRRILEDTISGKRKDIRWGECFPSIGKLTRALLPGTVTVICGDPGSLKSFLVLQCAAYWHRKGESVALYELEEDRAYHLHRALAQADLRSDITNPDWIKENPGEARAAFAQHQEFLDSFGRCIDAAPDEQPTLEQVAEWVGKKCAAGARIIVIDPITAAASTDKPWIDDLKFLMRVKTLARMVGARIILVTHPRKGQKKFGGGLDDLAGGAAYQRFAQTVLWVERHDQPKRYRCQGPDGPFTTDVNCTIKLKKTRNGRGAGLGIGLHFDGGSLCFAEQGTILREEETPEVSNAD